MEEKFLELGSACKQAITNGTPVLFKNFMEDPPSWEDFLKAFDKKFNETENHVASQYPRTERMVNDVIIRGLVYFSMILRDKRDELSPKVYDLAENLKLAMGNDKINMANALMSIARDRHARTDIHADPLHTFYLQCEGDSVWHLFESREHCNCCVNYGHSSVVEIPVSRGDLLFLPEGIFHTIDVVEPRAAIVIRQEHNEKLPDRGALNPSKIVQI